MSGHLTSGSAAERFVNCPSSAVLPQVRSSGTAAFQGRANHKAIEDVLAKLKALQDAEEQENG